MSEPKHKRRWFFPVVTPDDAHDAIKIAYQTTFALAGIHAVLILIFSWSSGRISGDILDPVLMGALAMTLKSRPSRLAATVLLAYAVLIGTLTLLTRLGFHVTDFGGKNVILAALFIYAGYKGVQGIFGFHRIYGTKTSFKNVAKLALILLGYLVGVTIIYLAMLYDALVGNASSGISDDWLGILWILPVVAIVFSGCLGWLPGTREIRVTQALAPEVGSPSDVKDNPSP